MHDVAEQKCIIATHQYVNCLNDAKATTWSATEEVLSIYDYDVSHVSLEWD